MEFLTTARQVIMEAVRRTDLGLRDRFVKSDPFIRFESGKSATIENEVTKLSGSRLHNPFPLVAMFTEGVTEWTEKGVLSFKVPKIAIVIRTKTNTNESQKLHDSFAMVLHPIYREFERQLGKMYFGYGLRVEHSDLPCMTDAAKSTSLNQLCDAVIIKNLNFKYLVKNC